MALAETIARNVHKAFEMSKEWIIPPVGDPTLLYYLFIAMSDAQELLQARMSYAASLISSISYGAPPRIHLQL